LDLLVGRDLKEKRMVHLAMNRLLVSLIFLLSLYLPVYAQTVGHSSDLIYINTSFESASPLYWEIDANRQVHVYLVYDQERASPNRANGHWLFEVQAKPGAELTLVLHNFDNIWNGRKGSPINERTVCFISQDGKAWRAIPTEKTAENHLKIQVTVDGGSLYLARLEPYRLSDLEALKQEFRDNRAVEITTIGRTVEGRELEIVRIGNPAAAHRVLLRARAHPWEAGGNWVVHGLAKRLLAGDDQARRHLDTYCVYIMPMANKDGVARGWTRFNMLGADLNRKWDAPADPDVNPENHALERWLESVVARRQGPQLMIDLHNDEGGKLHIARPDVKLDTYLKNMARLEAMLREHTWFTEGSTGANYRNPGSIGEGLLERFGIDACVLELNANWIAGLNAPPSARSWKLFGAQLCEALYHYFQQGDSDSAR
jgi:hypothetical protein